MLKTVFILLCAAWCGSIWSQGSIQGFTVHPSSPSVHDKVEIYVEVAFPSGPCLVDNKDFISKGDSTLAFGHYCIASLMTTCNTIDTFKLGYMSSGNKLFKFTLTSGTGGSPCTPGIKADDVDSVNFFVAPSLGIHQNQLANRSVTISPNPFYEQAIITVDKSVELMGTSLIVSDAQGRVVTNIENIPSHQFCVERQHLVKGLYFYRLVNKHNTLFVGKLMVD